MCVRPPPLVAVLGAAAFLLLLEDEGTVPLLFLPLVVVVAVVAAVAAVAAVVLLPLLPLPLPLPPPPLLMVAVVAGVPRWVAVTACLAAAAVAKTSLCGWLEGEGEGEEAYILRSGAGIGSFVATELCLWWSSSLRLNSSTSLSINSYTTTTTKHTHTHTGRQR